MMAPELATLIVANGLGVFSTNLFIGSAAGDSETGNGPYTYLREVGGMADLETQNQRDNPKTDDGWERPSVQVVVKAKDYLAAASQLARVRKLMSVVRNEVIGAYTFPLTSLARAGSVVTGTTSALHRFYAGQTVTIAGASDAAYNGPFVVTSVPTTRTFTYTIVGTPATPATGSLSVAFAGTKYQSLVPVQVVIDLGTDTSQRVQLAFNVRGVKRRSVA